MKRIIPKRSQLLLTISLLAVLPMFLVSFIVQEKEPWTSSQLVEPMALASIISDSKTRQPVILSVGPGAVIKGSHDMGPAGENANLKRLNDYLGTLEADADIVIYCGCCPFNKCPNIRPAFALLNTLGFKNHKLLNIAQNIKTDWIDRGYPVAE